jgi:hypothetical protein
MTGERIGDTWAKQCPRRRQRDLRQRGINLTIEPLIGKPYRVETAGLGEASAFRELLHRRIAKHQQSKAHNKSPACVYSRDGSADHLITRYLPTMVTRGERFAANEPASPN